MQYIPSEDLAHLQCQSIPNFVDVLKRERNENGDDKKKVQKTDKVPKIWSIAVKTKEEATQKVKLLFIFLRCEKVRMN